MISASLSLSLPRLGWKSTSTPRSLKICTAAGDSASEIRTLGLDMGVIHNAGTRPMHLTCVTPGLNPRVLSFLMDGRVEPGHDDRENDANQGAALKPPSRAAPWLQQKPN